MNKKLLSLCFFWIATTLSNLASAEYSFSILPSLGGTNYFVNDINNSNQIVGWSVTSDNNFSFHATLWTNGSVQDLGTLGGDSSVALAINDLGKITGYSQSSGNSANHAVLWNNNSIEDLGTFNGDDAAGVDINNNGQIAIHTFDGSTLGGHTYIYDTQTNIQPDISTATQSLVSRMNNYGQAVGLAYNTQGFMTAASWQNGVVTYLLAESNGRAIDINDSGQIVGATWDLHRSYAVSWINGELTKLAGLNDQQIVSSTALGINNHGQIVGGYDDFAALWMDNQLIDLNSYLSQADKDAGWILNLAVGINDKGSIIGVAQNRLTGADSSFLLLAVTTVPEPESYALIILGLGLMSIASKRKQIKHNLANLTSQWALFYTGLFCFISPYR